MVHLTSSACAQILVAMPYLIHKTSDIEAPVLVYVDDVGDAGLNIVETGQELARIVYFFEVPEVNIVERELVSVGYFFENREVNIGAHCKDTRQH